MRIQRRESQIATQRVPLWTALLVIFALLSHSLDACAAHTGLPDSHDSSGAQQGNVVCPHPASFACEICALPSQPDSECCDPLTEIAVLHPSSQHPAEHEIATLEATVAVLPVLPQLIALSGCLHGRAGPPPTAPLPVFLRSSLPSRAPPLSA